MSVSNGKFTAALSGLLLATSTLGHAVDANAMGFEVLTPHRAVYEVTFDEATERSGIDQITGRIVYEMTGNECEGMSINYRFVSRVNANGEIFTSDQQSASHEEPDGGQYTFMTRSFVNEQLDRVVKGVAVREGDALNVALASPQERTLELESATFISSHIVDVIERARAGERFFSIDVFDGGDDADEVLKTSNIVGTADVYGETLEGENAAAAAKIADKPAWPVTIAYFKKALTDSTESVPIYEVSFLLYEGGISRRLKMSYPDYTIRANLTDLEFLDDEPCSVEN